MHRRGYFQLTDWNVNSKLQGAIDKQLVSLMEKCGGVRTSLIVLNRLPQQDASMLRRLRGRLKPLFGVRSAGWSTGR